MLVHFQFKPLYQRAQKQSWAFSFYFKGQFVSGTYHFDGSITWTDSQVDEQVRNEQLKQAVHDLMLYHVYEEEHQPKHKI
ncbi:MULTISPECIES: YheE family protein [Shouchella]|uniref:Uncharacterized protein n=3 Tax=Bacillaceae TaxID=186817 RepID=A0A060LUS5_9BACI|nr:MULTISPECIES: YheE family protein [Bacillaceae]AIC93912.1 hypothetical protein BleG1_1329 [Shouchella lehensis G1]KQL55855.1 hypothetical protein AN965_16355 [Alkalicoccobacillus plakortidis]MBG9785517.1 hypothetical protein [Shouchella lehensis]TES47955.1 hypothetical protein E2L03_12525 [Shouchella lehensis]